MTGSGATCFGIYENTNEAIKAEELCKAKFKKCGLKEQS